MRWISVRNWRKFQHYDPARRQPPWIKNYTELLHSEAYLELTAGARSLLHGIWLEYASAQCELKFDARSLGRKLNLRATKQQLESLNHAGFIDIVASAALAEGYHDASAALASRARAHSQETETETEGPVSKEKNHSLETAASAPAEDAPNPFTPTSSGSAQQLVGEFVDACRETGIEAPRRTIGQVAQETGKLVSEGIEPDAIRAGYRRMVQRGLVQPSLLANFVAEASIPNGVRARASGQGLTPAEILEITRENP